LDDFRSNEDFGKKRFFFSIPLDQWLENVKAHGFAKLESWRREGARLEENEGRREMVLGFSREKKKKTKDNLCGPVCFVVLI
jgi:hypothetical protein